MTTLAERLRAVDVYDEHDCFMNAKLFGEAADGVERLERDKHQLAVIAAKEIAERNAKIDRLRAVIIRAKDGLLDGQSTQQVHDMLVAAVLWRKP